MITIVFGPPKNFKTFYLTCKALEIMKDKERYKNCLKESDKLFTKQGLKFILNRGHCIFSNFQIVNCCHAGGNKESFAVNPYTLCLPNSEIPFTLIPPYSAIFIMEGQSYYNSRKSKKFRMEVIQFFANHGHAHFDIFIDTHRPGALDLYVRDLAARIVTVLDVKQKFDNRGRLEETKLYLLEFTDIATAESYCDSGNKQLGKKIVEIYKGNIFRCYNAFENLNAFYKGCGPENINYLSWEKVDSNFLLPPQNYYEK